MCYSKGPFYPTNNKKSIRNHQSKKLITSDNDKINKIKVISDHELSYLIVQLNHDKHPKQSPI